MHALLTAILSITCTERRLAIHLKVESKSTSVERKIPKSCLMLTYFCLGTDGKLKITTYITPGYELPNLKFYRN